MSDPLESTSMTSLVTRCPACSTHFKVVPDQLRISDGWVRCGQCDEVFDAQAHMQSSIEKTAAYGNGSAPVVATPPAPEDAAHPARADFDPVLEDALVSLDDSARVCGEYELPPVQEDFSHAVTRGHEAPGEQLARLQAPAATLRGDSDLSALDAVTEPDSAATEGLRYAQNPAPAHVAQDAGFLPSFLQNSRPSSTLQGRWFRGIMLVLLGPMLLLQVVVQQRDRIAATEPAFAAGLQFLCQAVGCRVAPLRQIESIVIESSSFIKVKSDVYRLSFSVKNTALVPLALPFAELALTDLRDQSVLRRVLAPAEYGARTETLAPGQELALVVPLAVKASAQMGDKVTGYRLLVFYP